MSGSSDVTLLTGLKGAILKLKDEFFAGHEGVIIKGERREQLDKRLFMIEHEIDGLLKRRISYTIREGETSRTMDYTGILNEKENQIVELEKKIQNLEERLRRAGKRENEL